ncbi:phosphatase PAP2 family protein [Pseudalkalibacillus berkeleyi]|uniref:Phosphatase PAP2 family protein n=1 Tax=Pseudalkalibacillus berkeleyi TaxID=1069813 RepID=A0ABS9H3H4_9BACL|nr:phosphatase PAP2 family protein [Pseudalkalibacillus berkeleyi]MCF6138353.1 phosphatase PAP2 family protein [Pseudalkalibacillus berkeleyi]
MIRKHPLLLIGLTLVILFVLFGVFHNTLTQFDLVIMHLIWDIRSDWLSTVFVFITEIGSAKISIPLMILLVIYFSVNKNSKLALILMFNLIGVRTMNRWLKAGFNRTRPDENPLIEVGGLSFPSGHSMNSTAFFGFLGYLIWVVLRKKGREAGYVLWVTGGLILLIGLSRVYLGVHFPSDVLAGFTAGGIWLILTILLFKGLSNNGDKGDI